MPAMDRAELDRLIGANTIDQTTGFSCRGNPQLVFQQTGKPLKLSNSLNPLPGRVIKLDDALLDQFLQRLDTQGGKTGRQGILQFSDGGVMFHQTPVAAQTKDTKPLTLAQDPIVIPSEQEVAAIMSESSYQLLEQTGRQLALRRAQRGANSVFEGDDVEPDWRGPGNPRLAAWRQFKPVRSDGR